MIRITRSHKFHLCRVPESVNCTGFPLQLQNLIYSISIGRSFFPSSNRLELTSLSSRNRLSSTSRTLAVTPTLSVDFRLTVAVLRTGGGGDNIEFQSASCKSMRVSYSMRQLTYTRFRVGGCAKGRRSAREMSPPRFRYCWAISYWNINRNAIGWRTPTVKSIAWFLDRHPIEVPLSNRFPLELARIAPRSLVPQSYRDSTKKIDLSCPTC